VSMRYLASDLLVAVIISFHHKLQKHVFI